MTSQDKAAAPEGIQDEDDYLNRMGTLVSSRANKEKDIQAKAVQKEFQPQVRLFFLVDYQVTRARHSPSLAKTDALAGFVSGIYPT
jgi:hypothetical protein